MSRTETLARTRWLELRNILYRPHPEGEEKAWTYATRPDCPGAVCVIATTTGPAPDIILVRQQRLPAGRPVIEMPAGLMDPGEAPAETALRELAEETGWEGAVTGSSPETYTSAGLTDESIFFVQVRLTREGAPRPDGDEQIEVLRWPLAELRERLEAAAAAGDGVDAKLWTYALARS